MRAMLRVLAVVARLVAPMPGDVTSGDVEAAAISSAEWFVDLRLLSRADTLALDPSLRACGTNNRCISAELEKRGIDRVLYVVASLESGFATAELLERSSSSAIATEAIEIEGSVGRAVADVVTRALSAAGHRRGARFAVDVTPENAIVRVESSTIASGEQIVVASGKQQIAVSAPGFTAERRTLELEPGQELAIHIRLESAPGTDDDESIFGSWWLWGGVAVAAAAAIAVPLIVFSSPGDPNTFCYGTSQTLCEMGR